MKNPYSPPESDVATSIDEVEYVGFWIRVVASLIDTLLMLVITLPLIYAAYGVDGFMSEKIINGPADVVINYVLPAVLTILLWIYFSATPGKMIVGAIIVDEKTLAPISKGQSISRYLGYYVSMLPVFLGFFWVGWDKRKRGWHDMMAGTVVIKKQT